MSDNIPHSGVLGDIVDLERTPVFNGPSYVLELGTVGRK